MVHYAALLRGIGPGNPSMRNDALRGVFSALGFSSVRSVISSGNILFATPSTDTPALESLIQDALRRELGIAGGTLVRSRSELQALADSDPFQGREHGRSTYLTATFLKHPPAGPGVIARPEHPAMHIVGYDAAARAVLAVTDTTAAKTPDFMAWLERHYGKDITTRTWLTVHRILARMPPA